MKFAVLGFGQRGTTYTRILQRDGRAQLVAVCDIKAKRGELAQRKYGLDAKDFYLSDKEFFAQGKLADLLIISTMDQSHYAQAMQALKIGYDLLLEKPMAHDYGKCKKIYDLAKKLKRKVFVCHVLRYAPFFTYIKDEIASGKYGDVVSINLTENVIYWHQAHSFVRGNWSVTEKSTPMIVQKCCHDLDILYWLIDKKPLKVSSFGSLTFYNEEHAPQGSADHCVDCPVSDKCEYNCFKFYHERPGWMKHDNEEFTGTSADIEKIDALLSDRNNPYSRCVFKCDNSAVDHQVVNVLYEDNVTAHLTMTAFTQGGGRDIHVHCTKGDIIGSMENDYITTNVFGKESKTIEVGKLTEGNYGHGGGDSRLIGDILEIFEDGKEGKALTIIDNSIASHATAYAAEKSRKKGGKTLKIKM